MNLKQRTITGSFTIALILFACATAVYAWWRQSLAPASRISIGMTAAEVQSILGPPKAIGRENGHRFLTYHRWTLPNLESTWVYLDDNGFVTDIFVDNGL